MPVIETKKLLITDPYSGRVIRCNIDGSSWEEWGHHYGGTEVPLTVDAINPDAWDNYCDAYYDEVNCILYFASDGKGILKLDLQNNTTAVYDIGSGSLRNNTCYGLIVNAAGTLMIVLHGANGISIIDPSDGTQINNFACASAVCGKGVLNQAETEIVVWDSTMNASTPAKITLADGTVVLWDWDVMPHAGSAYVDDCDFSDNDNTLYVELHFSSTPGGGHRHVHVTVTPATMIPSAWNWLAECGDYKNLYGNTGVVDASVGYYAHAFRFNSSTCKMALYRLSDNQYLATYDTTSSPIFGNKNAINWWTIFLGKGMRGRLRVCHTQYYYYDASNQCAVTIYIIDPVTLLWSLKYNVLHRPDVDRVEPNKQDGVDPAPVFMSRKIPDYKESQYLMQFHEYTDHFLLSNAQPGSYGQTPHLFDKDWPWCRPWGIYRHSVEGRIYVGDMMNGALADYKGNAIARYLGWKEGGRLALSYGLSKDGEGRYITQRNVGVIESEDKVVYDSKRPAMLGVKINDFAFDIADYAEWVMDSDTDAMKVIDNCVYNFHYEAVQGHVFGGIYAGGAVLMPVEFNDLGPSSKVRDIWIDPDDGKVYLACTDKIARYNSFADEGYVGFGSSGSGVNQFDTPRGIYGDTDYIYVADTGNQRIVRFDKAAFDGTGWTTFGTKGFAGEGTFSYPCKIIGMTVETGISEPEGMYLPPDMLRAITLLHSFHTTKFRTHGEKEFRAAHIYTPKRREIFRFATMDSALLATLFRQVQELRAEDSFYVPVWPYAMFLASDITALDTEITVLEASYRELPASGVLLLFQDVDNQEVVRFAARVGNEFSLTAGVASDFDSEDVIVVPCIAARFLEQQSLNRFERFKVLAEITFDEVLTATS